MIIIFFILTLQLKKNFEILYHLIFEYLFFPAEFYLEDRYGVIKNIHVLDVHKKHI